MKGSGENGRITKSDVENFTPSASAAPSQAASASAPSASEAPQAAAKPYVPAGQIATEEIKNSQMRKIIAKRLAESLFTAPHYNLVIEVTMDEAMKSRAVINSVPDTKVSFNDMVIIFTIEIFTMQCHPCILCDGMKKVTKKFRLHILPQPIEREINIPDTVRTI